MSFLLTQLNPPQREAVTHSKGPLLVLAGAGSGKTRIITYRVAYLIDQGVYPQQILAITFTNKAAKEMEDRVNALLGVDSSSVWLATIHATCARILRKEIEFLGLGINSNYSILDSSDQQSVIRRSMKELKISPKTVHPSHYSKLFSKSKNKVPFKAEIDDLKEPEDYQVKKMWELYQKRLIESNCLDFDDLLLYTDQLFSQFPDVLERYQKRWLYQMVDEYQDINNIQYEIIKKLAASHKNLCVVGDDDQSIYRWRGAEVKKLLNFDKDFSGAKMIILDQNYRSTKNIISAASSVCKRIEYRKEKQIWTENKNGSKLRVYIAKNEYDEARYCVDTIKEFYERDHYNWDDFAILYRTNAQSRVMEEMFTKYEIPYYLVGEIGFYKRREIKDLLAYLYLLAEQYHQEAFLRIINVPTRGIGAKTLEKVKEWAEQNRKSYMTTIEDAEFLETVPAKARNSLISFSKSLQTCEYVLHKKGLSEGLKCIISEFKYLEFLKDGGEITAQSRIENVGQLVTAATHFQETFAEGNSMDCLQNFLDKVALASEADEYDKKSNRVALMTLHCAKGLEFPIVILAGVVEGLLPHSLALKESREQVDEERRLCYVGITRSQKHLFLTCPISRSYFGRPIVDNPSRFLDDIPEDLKIIEKNASLGFNAFTGWNARPRRSFREPVKENLKPSAKQFTSVAKTSTKQQGNQKGFRLGTRVKHQRWGQGTVIQVMGKGDRLKLLVSFPGFGRKILLAKLAPIEVIEY